MKVINLSYPTLHYLSQYLKITKKCLIQIEIYSTQDSLRLHHICRIIYREVDAKSFKNLPRLGASVVYSTLGSQYYEKLMQNVSQILPKTVNKISLRIWELGIMES